MLKETVNAAYREARQMLNADAIASTLANGNAEAAIDEFPPPPFSYGETNLFFKKNFLEKKQRRPHLAWGALQGVNLAKALGLSRVSFVEFGVAGGNGLTAL